MARLVKQLLDIFKERFSFESVNLWTESTIALCWVESHPSRWTTFVCNRVAQIQEDTADCSGRHVVSAENPADLPSRGISPQDLVDSSLWFSGPEFLRNAQLNLREYDFHFQSRHTTMGDNSRREENLSFLHSTCEIKSLF